MALTPDQLYIEQATFERTIIAINKRIFIVNTKELFLVQLKRSKTIVYYGHKLRIFSISTEAKLVLGS